MKTSIQPFKLERYFARYEFSAPYLLSPSDCESLSLEELLGLADEETLALWRGLKLGYTDSHGNPLLRQEIASLYEHLSPEEVLVLAPEEGIYILMHTLLEPGDEVIVIQPAYQSLQEVARSIGCSVIPWNLQLGDEGWQLDLAALRGLVSDRTRLLVINFPHNPTGFLPSLEQLEAIVDLARQYNLYLFSDEMYRCLEYRPEHRLPAVGDLYDLGISLSGMSKSFSLPGLRIGWLATRTSGLLESCLRLKDYTTICSSAPSEILSLMALRARDPILKRNLDIIDANRKAAAGFFGPHAELFIWLPPKAGSVAFPIWKGSGPAEAFCQRAVEERGVMVVPGSMFDSPGQHFRVGLGRLNFPEALKQLEPLVDSVKGS